MSKKIMPFSEELTDLKKQAEKYLNDNQFELAINIYEKLIDLEPNNKSHYWYLGLNLLLKDQEVEAQTTWLFALSDGTEDEINTWTIELITILENEAHRRTAIEDYSLAWVIRQHIREINPEEVNNLLQIIDLAITIQTYTGDEIEEFNLINLLNADLNYPINADLLIHVLEKVLNQPPPLHPACINFIKVCFHHITDSNTFTNILIPFIHKVGYSWFNKELAITLAELCLDLIPNNHEILRVIVALYCDVAKFSQAIELGKISYTLSSELVDQIYDNHQLIKAVMLAEGCSQQAITFLERQESLIRRLANYDKIMETSTPIVRLYSTSFYFTYVQDYPQRNIELRNYTSQFCQKTLEHIFAEEILKYQEKNLSLKTKFITENNQVLKIGYISNSLRKHSVGWLARWLFNYHNRDEFKIYTYLPGTKHLSDPVLDWYVSKSDKAHKCDFVTQDIAQQISDDQINILVDLDSLTVANISEILAMKPAPVQLTWLGWDTSSIPTIDYFIADPYVLPKDAENYYQEKIWRLPHTYLAVDGFAIDVPNIRRDQYDIPTGAVVYYTSQLGPKYHPHTLKLQIEILKEVENSYCLVKLFGNPEQIKKLFIETAESLGVNPERLKFLPTAGTEEIHRANLGIADIVLDTYPYNGATTTMETLWMGIPLVTKVGEQFAARNSYTMMINAGITEGIAWTDEEYVEWGIRLGKDENLRRDISWKLKKGRQTAPLWDAKQFTKNMENAYQQMWQIYLDGDGK